jgi:hypothetical protein
MPCLEPVMLLEPTFTETTFLDSVMALEQSFVQMKLQTPTKITKHAMNPKPFQQPFFESKMTIYAMDSELFQQLFFESNMTKYVMDLEPFSYSFEEQSLSNETLALEEL